METFGQIFFQPGDVWNLAGGLLMLVVGFTGMILLRHQLQQAIAQRERAGAIDEARQMRQRLQRLTKVLAVVDIIIMPFLGYFLLGPVFRQVFGG